MTTPERNLGAPGGAVTPSALAWRRAGQTEPRRKGTMGRGAGCCSCRGCRRDCSCGCCSRNRPGEHGREVARLPRGALARRGRSSGGIALFQRQRARHTASRKTIRTRYKSVMKPPKKIANGPMPLLPPLARGKEVKIQEVTAFWPDGTPPRGWVGRGPCRGRRRGYPGGRRTRNRPGERGRVHHR